MPPPVSIAAPFFAGIAGASASGKTLLARGVVEALGRAGAAAAVLPLDAYYRDLSHLPLAERRQRNFDHPSALDLNLLRAHLRALAAGQGVALPAYRYATSTRREGAGPALAAGLGCIVVEGLYALYWPEVRDLLGLAVFLDAPEAVCQERRLARDTRERNLPREYVVEQFARDVWPMYLEHVAPTRQFADLVLSGEAAIKDSVARVAAEITKRGALPC